MAFVTQRSGGRWEVRESISTSAGPRSRTLATFERLTEEVLDHAAARASRPFDRAAVRAAARRKAAPVEPPAAERAARELTGLLAQGHTLSPALAGVLASLLTPSQPLRPSDAAQAAAQWVGSSLEDRAAALEDLLLLADALPARTREEHPTFPRLTSQPVPAG